MPVIYCPLGHADIKVSVLCLSTMTHGEQNSETEAHKQLDQAFDADINLIDTADMYPVPARTEIQGLTERYIGTWLTSRGRRDRVILATKVAGLGEWLNYTSVSSIS
ncbi:MAG: aldo/keto reductase [Candidatus Thiodiazotropha sp. (ex Lucinoma aequizonata)]|nr:aldo/keto reductase [Candidatus Thiodiazotropha sp. (ex Lucinoma aequizonata)]MCU7887719.1 aldo/keto reductase [Candidatus Thiodiazotropha sp. (ex Lucinoma aequizonata)]MCU7896732.1 aldo/keto reductase [Candidatus Thiodiazotropha sp. (ex Lucinoma aequizonata)]MCU7898918.1 aldo/keto reductase [Candidatus Thiodiazotropha sp. (ex Lucinoma aequizonata)]MCU7901219.1 aldo/keto reductase [Candidatus Thiodiazotropha sp. (ex Lucinoma aequizonata)]